MVNTMWVEILVAHSLLWIMVVRAQDRVLIAEASSENETEISASGNETIPELLLIQMSNVPSASEFLRRFALSQEERPSEFSTISTSFALSNNKKPRQFVPSPDSIAQPASCQPELHVVELDKPENGLTLHWPSCVRVRRCGGCCTSNLLACQPVDTSLINVTVLQMKYNLNSGALEAQGTKSFSLEQHNKCSCSCKERHEHCNPDVHEYKGNECRCVCKNETAATACGPKRIWDKKNCICKCRNVRLCSTGRYFNIVSCRCELMRRSQAVGNFDRLNNTADLNLNQQSNFSS